MADRHVIRPITDDEYAAFRRVHDHSFNSGPAPAARWPRLRRQFEAERSLAAFDSGVPAGGGLVGTTGVYSFQMAVPGAVLPVAGVTAVSVLPTHRRRGILRSLMTRQITDIAARGDEPIAALWASETPLYGRYGYGRASSHAFFRFGRGEGALSALAPADPDLTLRLAEPGEVAADLAKVYETVLPGQPGFFSRNEDWWERVLDDPAEERHGASPLRCLLAADGAGLRGYALYRSTPNWEEGTVLPDGVIDVWELVAADPAASAALWRDLLSRDLVGTMTADLRPVDDPLLYQLYDSRRARVRLVDDLWVRVIDLPGALASRAYAAPVDVVLEVADALLPANAGRWRLRSSGVGGTADCVRTDDAADLALDVRELGAAYLGGTRLAALAAAGLVSESRPGAVGRLSTAMGWDPAPWCPRVF
ncbi:MAG TPA: GNAT family N-acetyltransferase [Trebonia sp.]|jgi:predicted acetyltransferase|nr:GNAT family N-acetyltransferase [Trebonia sp.]